MQHNQFIWQPYTQEVLDSIPDYCTAGRDIWMSSVYLICWHVVEPHCPNRVLRQFGFHQHIPDNRLHSEAEFKSIHCHTRRGRPNTNWEHILRLYVTSWSERREHVVQGSQQGDVSEYMAWYMPRTGRYIENPARLPMHCGGFQGSTSRANLFEEGVANMHQMSQSAMQHPGCSMDELTFAQMDRYAAPLYTYARDPIELHLPQQHQQADAPHQFTMFKLTNNPELEYDAKVVDVLEISLFQNSVMQLRTKMGFFTVRSLT